MASSTASRVLFQGPRRGDDLGLAQPVDGLVQRVVVAVAGAAHRRLDAGLGQSLAVADRDVLRAAVTVVHQDPVTLGPARTQRQIQRVEHEVGLQRGAGPPAHDVACDDVDDEGDVGEASPCANMTCAARRVRGDVRNSPPRAAELGQAAEAGFRDRHGALPELRRRTEDHRGDSRATGHRPDAHAPGSAGRLWTHDRACARACAIKRGARLPARARPAGHRRARQPAGRNCKRPETLQPTRFRRHGDQGRRDWLRQSFSEPRIGARSPRETRRRSPRMKLFWAVVDPQ